MITAQQAEREAKKAVKRLEVEKRKKQKDKELQQKRNIQYAIKELLPKFLIGLEQDITDAAKASWTEIVRVTGDNSIGEVIAERCKTKLLKAGYQVSIKWTWVDAYGGSSDDGYAYAHDAYQQWHITVSWKKGIVK